MLQYLRISFYQSPSHSLKTFKWLLMALKIKYKIFNIAYNKVHGLALPTSSFSCHTVLSLSLAILVLSVSEQCSFLPQGLWPNYYLYLEQSSPPPPPPDHFQWTSGINHSSCAVVFVYLFHDTHYSNFIFIHVISLPN